ALCPVRLSDKQAQVLAASSIWCPATGGAGKTTPGLAGAGCTQACRPRCWRLFVWTSRGAVHQHAPQPGLWSFHTALSKAAPQRAAGSFSPNIGSLVLARIRVLAGRAYLRRNRVRHLSLQNGRPVRPCLVVNPGGGRQ